MAKPAQAERSHCPATRPRVCAAFDSAPQAHHGAGTDAGDPPAGGRNTAADRAGRAGPAGPTDRPGRPKPPPGERRQGRGRRKPPRPRNRHNATDKARPRGRQPRSAGGGRGSGASGGGGARYAAVTMGDIARGPGTDAGATCNNLRR